MKRIGVVGFGRRIDHVLKNVTKLSDGEVEVVAYYDPSPKAAARVSANYPAIGRCESLEDVVKAADYVFSTGGMIKFARETDHQKIIIGTEMGMVYRLQKENPEKEIYLLAQGLVCPNMKYTNLEKIATALETLQPQITVPQPIRDLARRPLERMLTIA